MGCMKQVVADKVLKDLAFLVASVFQLATSAPPPPNLERVALSTLVFKTKVLNPLPLILATFIASNLDEEIL